MENQADADTAVMNAVSELLDAIEEHGLSALDGVDAQSIQDLFEYLERYKERRII